MVWVRLDDGMLDNPKVAAHLGPLGIAMQVAGLLWSARNLTDGLIPSRVVPRLLSFEELGRFSEGDEQKPDDLVMAFRVNGWTVLNTEILPGNFWHDVETAETCPSPRCHEAPRPESGEFLIHDYLVYQRSKAQVLAERARTADRVQRFRGRNAPSNDVTNAPVTVAPVPVPVPVPQLQDPEAFDRFWEAFPRKVGKRKALAAYVAASKRTDEERIIEGAKRYAADPNREDLFTAHPTTWLNRDGWADPPLPARGNGKQAKGANAHLAALADRLENR